MVNQHIFAIGLVAFLISSLSSAAQWSADNTVNNPIVVHQGRQEPAVACSDGAGGAFVAWYDNRGVIGNNQYDVYVQRINSNGQILWASSGVSLGVLTFGLAFIEMVPDGNGGAVVIFVIGSSSTFDIVAQRLDANGNKLWNNGNTVMVCNAPDAQSVPKITWQDKRSGITDIYAQKLNGNGIAQWLSNGVVVNAAVNSQLSPQITGIGNGEVLISWQDQRTGTNDVYCQKLNAAGVRQWRGLDNLLSGRAICTASGNQVSPTMCTDGTTGAIIAWQDFRMGTTTNGDIYAQRIDSSGQVKWTGNGVVLCSTSSVQDIANISFTGDGAAVCWTDYPNSNDFNLYDIHAQKIDTLGVPQWGTNGLAVCNAAELQNISNVAGDGNGGAFFTWIDRREGGVSNVKIYGQRISSNGTATWGTNGLVVCGNTNYSRGNPEIVATGCNAIFVWEDQLNSCCGIGDVDVYATKLDCDGKVIGASSGISWTGSVSTDWMTPGNWSSNSVPTINDDVTIPSGTTFSPVVNSGAQAVCKTIKVNNGASVTVSTGGDLKVAQ